MFSPVIPSNPFGFPSNSGFPEHLLCASPKAREPRIHQSGPSRALGEAASLRAWG